MVKTCTKCKIEKELSEFGRDKYSKDGLTTYCKLCRAANTLKWRKENPNKSIAYKKSDRGRESARRGTAKYRKKHPDRIQAYHQSFRGKELARQRRKRYYYRHKDVESWRFKNYYYDNHEKEKQRQREYYNNNPEKIKIYTKESYPRRKQYVLDWNKKDQKENPWKWNARNAKRRVKLLQATPFWVDLDEIKKIYEKCPIGYEVDHIVPLQNKNVCGLHVPWNLQYLTKSENCSKNNKF